MQIPDDIAKCVVFLCADRGGPPGGTAFLVGYDLSPGLGNVGYLITAKHSLDAVSKMGRDSIWIRLNIRGGGIDWAEAPLSQWESHPDDALDNPIDVAVLPVNITDKVDYLAHPIANRLTDNIVKEHEIAAGDEIVMPGLFVHHSHTRINNPVIRVGNIAAMRAEPVKTALGLMDAYIVETRSVGGLSGSPVFVYLGIVRMIGGQVKHAAGNYPMYFLLGLMHGHWREKNTLQFDPNDEYVNLGLAIVVPIERAVELIERSERLTNLRLLTEQDRSKENLTL